MSGIHSVRRRWKKRGGFAGSYQAVDGILQRISVALTHRGSHVSDRSEPRSGFDSAVSLRLPVGPGGLVLRARDTWPGTGGTLADLLARVQVSYPSVPIVFCETRPLAEEWTFRFSEPPRSVSSNRRTRLNPEPGSTNPTRSAVDSTRPALRFARLAKRRDDSSCIGTRGRPRR